MEEIGVAAVVNELSSFLGDMGRIDSAIRSIFPTSKLLGGAFDWLSGVISSFGSSVLRVIEYTLGNLLASAIQSVVGWLQELGAGVLESADTFARLQIRLERMNFNAAKDSGMEYNDAMKEATRLTKEQLEWTIRLGAQTPFDAVDIASVFTLARSYGFTADEAKGLTGSIIDFTSGMGLTNVEMERIIINFGQLRQQGKLNAQDLRDLARGAYVPINDVLAITAQKLGLTTEEFNKQRKAGTLGAEAVDVFRKSFEELVGIKFEGSAEALGNVFNVAIENINHLIRDMLALYNVLPILTLIGSYFQDITDAIADNDERWNSMTDSMKRISDVTFDIVSTLLGIAPSAETIADGIVEGLDNIATWLETHKADIVDWVNKAIGKIGELKDWIFGTEEKKGAIQNFFDWLGSPEVQGVLEATKKLAKDLMTNLFGGTDAETGEKKVGTLQKMYDILVILGPVVAPLIDLFGSIGNVIATAFGGTETQTFSDFVTETLIPGIKDLTKWFDDNKDSIAELLGLWLRGAVILLALSGVVAILAGVVGEVASLFVGWITTNNNWLTVMYILLGIAAIAGLVIAGIEAPILLVVAAIAILGMAIYRNWDTIKVWVSDTWASINKWADNIIDSNRRASKGFTDAVNEWTLNAKLKIINWVNDTLAEISKWGLKIYEQLMKNVDSMNWFKIGQTIIRGIIQGFISMVLPSIAPPAVSSKGTGTTGTNRATGTHGVKTVPPGFNADNFNIGLTSGEKFMVIPKGGQMSSAMAGSTVNSSQQIINNFNLAINSSANTEPIVQDFSMMASLAGV